MSYASRIVIKETTEELASLFNKTKDQRLKLKLKCLILFKKGDFKKQEDLANHLCIGYSTLRLWLKKYKQDGFDKFVMIPVKGRPKSCITAEIHDALEAKLSDSNAPLQGYWDAVSWLKDTMDVSINYQALRNYMIKHFKTKLKVPRKSHYKKDEQAIEAFFKTT